MKHYRQGDVLLKAIPALPAGERTKRENGVLAYGEVTGHSHAVADHAAAEVYELDGGLFLSVTDEGGVSIVHEEHEAITVPKGDYAVTIQREYSPLEIRNVAD
jgi:hypothetical protein